MATANEVLERHGWQGEVKLYIKSDSGTYTDLTSRFSLNALNMTGADRMIKAPAITHQSEGAYGQPTTKNVTIQVDNSDRYWDRTPPSGFTTFLGRDVQIRLKLADVSSESVLATFRVAPDGITTDDGPTAAIELEPLTESMRRADASGFKNGLQKYQYRSWLYFVKELIRSEFGNTSGALPAGYSFPTDPRITWPDGEKHFTTYGKPPQWDGSTWNDTNTDIPWDLDYDAVNEILYVGIGNYLWEYNPATDTWTNRSQDGTVGTGYPVQYIVNNTDYVLVLKWSATDRGASSSTTLYVTTWDKTNTQWHSTSRGSVTDFRGPGWFLFTGDGPSYKQKGDLGSPYSFNVGTNLLVPFAQNVDADNGTLFFRQDGVHSSSTTTYTSSSELEPGYYSLYRVTSPINATVQWGNRPSVEAYAAGSNYFWIFYASYNAGASKANISFLTFQGGSAIGSATEIIDNTTHTSADRFYSPRLVFCGALRRIVYIRFQEGKASGGEDTTSVEVVDLDGSYPNTPTALFTNTTIDADNYSYITDIGKAYGGSTTLEDLFITVMEADRLGSWPQFKIVRVSTPEGTPSFEDVEHSMMPPRTSKQSLVSYAIWMNQDTGALHRASNGSSTVTRMDSGIPPVFDAPFCASFIEYGTWPDVDFWGLSFPHHNPQTQVNTPDGKYFLWQYSDQHSGRVDLGDFDDLNKLEAVSLLCSAFRHAVYVNRDGNWIVEARDPSTTPTITISRDGHAGKGWLGLRDKSRTDVENYLESSPYETKLGAMNTQLFQKNTSDFNGTIRATQLDTKRRRVRLRCVNGGNVSYGGVRFDFLAFQDKVETRLLSNYISGTTVYLENVQDVAVGDQLQVLDNPVRTVTAVNTSTRAVTVSSGFYTSPILSEVVIIKAYNNKWSSQGVTILAEALDSSETEIDVDDASEIAIGNFIVVDEEEMEVTDKSGNTLTVTRGDNAAAHDDNATVACLVGVAGFEKFYTIGGQAISFSIGFDDTQDEGAFQVGDYIEFDCPGMMLDQARESKVISTDRTSIAAYGKRKPTRGPNNRFLTRQLMEYALDTRVTRYATPKRTLRLLMPFDLQLYLYDTVYVVSDALFPNDSNYKIGAIVREVVDDPARNQTTYAIEEQ